MATAPLRVGFVGAAVSEWTGIRDALRAVVESGRGVGVSSLRADRLDDEFVGLLAQGGYRTMTVAADAPSQREPNATRSVPPGGSGISSSDERGAGSAAAADT